MNEAISSGSRTSLLRALQMEGGKFKDVKPENMQWYMDFLAKAMSDKAESEVRVGSGTCSNDLLGGVFAPSFFQLLSYSKDIDNIMLGA